MKIPANMPVPDHEAEALASAHMESQLQDDEWIAAFEAVIPNLSVGHQVAFERKRVDNVQTYFGLPPISDDGVPDLCLKPQSLEEIVRSNMVTQLRHFELVSRAIEAQSERRPRAVYLFRYRPQLGPKFPPLYALGDAYKGLKQQPTDNQEPTIGVSNLGLPTAPYHDLGTSIINDEASLTVAIDREATAAIGADSVPRAIAGSAQTAPMDDFFKRPQRIYTQSWSPSSVDLFASISPTILYFGLPLVKARAAGYLFFRGDFHFRFVINASKYHYGACRIVPVPYEQLTVKPPLPSAFDPGKFTYAQLPGARDLNPNLTKSVELSVPYFGMNEHISFEWYNYGLGLLVAIDYLRLQFINMAQLRQLGQGTASSVTIDVFCWLDNYEFIGPTPNLNINPQGSDEYAKGPVQRAATTVATIASALSSLPVIGPFAKATEIASRAGAAIAGMFGFSLPPQIEAHQFFRDARYPSLASTIGLDTSYKMTIDPKQELSIDPAIVHGTTQDSMEYTAVCSRDLWIRNVGWTTAQAAGSTLANIPITPAMVHAYDPSANNHYEAMSPQSMVALAHTHWSGSMILRVHLVATQFHSGRVMLAWHGTPVGNDSAISPALYAGSTPNAILDLSTDTDVTLTIPYCSTGALKEVKVQDMQVDSYGNPLYCNGYVSVTVLTTLSAPNLSDSVTLMFSMSCGKDIRFFQPTLDQIFYYGYVNPYVAPGFAEEEDENVEDLNLKPQSADGKVLNTTSRWLFGSSQGHLPLPDVFFGEQSLSIRQLIKRFTVYGVFGTPTPTKYGTQSYMLVFKHHVRPRAAGTLRTNNGEANTPFALGVNKFTFASWFSQMYLAMRGGTRWKMQTDLGFERAPDVTWMVTRQPDATDNVNPALFYTSATIYDTLTARGSGLGAAIFGPETTPEVEVPSMATARYTPCKVAYPFFQNLSPYSTYKGNNEHVVFRGRFRTPGNTDPPYTAVTMWSAAADDMSFAYLTAGPILRWTSPVDP